MTALELVKSMEEKMEMPKEYYGAIEKYVPALIEDLKVYGVTFGENSAIGFASHAMGLIKRLETGEKVKDLGDEVLTQLEEEPLEISRKVIKPLENAYKVTLDHSELALLTIHVQTAIMKMKK